MRINDAFWKTKKVLITGHTGFKGAWLALWLTSKGCKVKGYALPPTTSSDLYELLDLQAHVESVVGNICDHEKLKTEMQSFAPDVIFHFAAQSLVKASYQEPIDTFQTNVIGTANVLDIAKELPSVRSIVVATSDKCYENKEQGTSFKEGDPLGGHDPYSASKAAAEIVTNCYRLSFYDKVPEKGLATVRAGNVIGGGDWAMDRLVPDAIRSFARSVPVIIRRPNATRPWQHVLEALSGYINLAEILFNSPAKASRAWNFGPGTGSDISVEVLMNKLVLNWGEGAIWKTAQSSSTFHEATSLKLNIQDAANLLGWQPELKIDQAVSWTVAWYKAWLNKANISELSLRQLSDYENQSSPSSSFSPDRKILSSDGQPI